MNKDNKEDIDSFYDEPDRLTLFMFGGKRSEKEDQTEHDQLNRTSEAVQDQQKKFTADEWLFGRRDRHHDEKNSRQVQSEPAQANDLLKNINMEELLGNIDTLVTSASQFKPLWKKITPIVNKWIK